MKRILSVLFALFVGCSTDHVFASSPRPLVTDTVNRPQLVQADSDGVLNLHAKFAAAIGPKIKYMPEWDAFGWFTAQDRVEWEVEVPRTGAYDVILEWSAEGSVVGNPYVFEAKGGNSLKGNVEATASWETFNTKNIGMIKLKAGRQRLIFRADPGLKSGGLLDLRLIRLQPIS